MKSSSWIITASALVTVFAACQNTKEDSSRSSSRNRFGYQGDANAATQFATPSPSPSATPLTEEIPTPSPEASPTPTTVPGGASTTARDIGYGTPVPGKPGFVTSPHAPYAGYVDVRGFPPGTEVKCPYTGKIFLVP